MKKWKNKLKRTAAIFLAALLVGNTVDLSAYAAPLPTSIVVAGVTLDTETYYKTENGTVTTTGAGEDNYNVYLEKDDDKYVLKLNGAVIEAEACGIYYSGYTGNLPLEIVITGSNRVEVTGPPSDTWLAAISISGQPLTISGTGTLTAVSNEETDAFLYGSAGIYASGEGASITINSGTVYAIAGDAETYSSAILADGDINVTDGQVYANYSLENGALVPVGGGEHADSSIGIRSEYESKINITGGSVYAYGGEGEDASVGIYINGTVDISGGVVKAVGGEAENASAGIVSQDDIEISGDASVNATGGAVETGISIGTGAGGGTEISGNAVVNTTGGAVETGISYGMCTGMDTGGECTIKGNAEVSAKGGDAENGSSVGIAVNGELSIKGTDSSTPQVTSESGKAEMGSVGMLSTGDVEIDGAQVEAIGNDASAGMSYGLAGQTDVTIKNTKMTAKSGTAGAGNSDAIGAKGNLTIINTEINAEGGEAKNGDSHGLAANKDIKISEDSEIQATAGDASGDSIGVGAEQNVEIDASKIFAKGSGAFRRSLGIGALKNASILNSKYELQGYTASISAVSGFDIKNSEEVKGLFDDVNNNDDDPDDDNDFDYDYDYDYDDDYDDSDDYDYDEDDNKKVVLPYGQWKQDAIGWWYQYTAGGYPAGSTITDETGMEHEIVIWDFIDGAWWAFGADGYADFGWVYDITLNGWFYVDGSTGMKTGWQFINSKWYYLNTESDGTKGKMYADTITPDGYYVDENGAWVE